MIIYGKDRECAAWAGRILKSDFTNCPALGVLRNNELVAACVYAELRNNGEYNDVRLHIASTTPRWATRDTISELLNYAFDDLNCNRVTGIVPVSNKKAIEFDKGIGFKQEGYHRQAGTDGEDCVSLALLRDEFLSGKYAPRQEYLNPNDLVPPHAAWDTSKLSYLTQSMKNGWYGHPIVVLKSDRLYALTGSHRIQVARELNIDVPVHYVKRELLKDDLFVQVLYQAGDFKSARLMQHEWDKFNGKTISTKTA